MNCPRKKRIEYFVVLIETNETMGLKSGIKLRLGIFGFETF